MRQEPEKKVSFHALICKIDPKPSEIRTLRNLFAPDIPASKLNWKTKGNVSYLLLTPKIETFLILEQNHGSLTYRKMSLDIFHATPQTLASKTDALISAHEPSKLNVGESKTIEHRNEEVDIHGGIVLDGRYQNLAPLRLYKCSGSVRDVLIFSPMGKRLGPVQPTWQAGFVYSRCTNLEIDNVWVVGGKPNHPFLNIGSSQIQVLNSHVGMTNDARGEGFGFYTGGQVSFPEEAEMFNYGHSYKPGNEYTAYRGVNNLPGWMGDINLVRAQYQTRHTYVIRIDYSHIIAAGRDAGSRVPPTERKWLLHWPNAPQDLTFTCASYNPATHVATIECRRNGQPYAIPKGWIGWFCWDDRWWVKDLLYENCRSVGLPTNKPVASGFTGYWGKNIIFRNNYSTNFRDRSLGVEFCENVVFTKNDAGNNGFIMTTFTCKNVEVFDNTYSKFRMASNGFPHINIHIRGADRYYRSEHQKTTMPRSGRHSYATNWFINCTEDGKLFSPEFVTVDDKILSRFAPGYDQNTD